MTTIIVWLLISTPTTGDILKFADQAACERVREEAISKIVGFHRGQSACIKAEIIKEYK